MIVIVFILLVLGVLLLLPAVTSNSRCPPGTEYPPGPKGLPILGSLLEIPPFHSWLQFFAWSKKYGPLYQISIAGRPHVIISTQKIADDLLRERGTLYSSRDQLPMAATLLSDNLRPLFLPYNDVWRRGRKVMHNLTMASAATSYQPIQEEESLRALKDLIEQPEKYETLFERYAGGLMMRIAFGKMIVTGEEEVLKRILRVVHTVERVASPGAYLVDTVRSLMYLPDFLAPFKKEARKLHAEELDLFRGLQNDVRGLKGGGENFTSKFLEGQEKSGLSDDEGAYVVGTLFEAGAGTTSAALMSFLLAMIVHPDAMRKLQEEVDTCVGTQRMPTFDDMANLPRVRAVVKETLRWRPVTAGGVPHQLVKDDVYEVEGKNYFIRAGSNVHANQWAIHRDPALYPEPEDFIPERWLEPKWPTFKEPLDVYPNLQNYSAFGFGRRICPGINVAERSLNILVARIAWACDVCGVSEWDYTGYRYTKGFNVQPEEFPLRVKPREGREAIVKNEYETVWPELLRQAQR